MLTRLATNRDTTGAFQIVATTDEDGPLYLCYGFETASDDFDEPISPGEAVYGYQLVSDY